MRDLIGRVVDIAFRARPDDEVDADPVDRLDARLNRAKRGFEFAYFVLDSRGVGSAGLALRI